MCTTCQPACGYRHPFVYRVTDAGSGTNGEFVFDGDSASVTRGKRATNTRSVAFRTTCRAGDGAPTDGLVPLVRPHVRGVPVCESLMTFPPSVPTHSR